MTAFTSWQMARRAREASGVVFAAFVVLGGAFFRAQVLQHQHYRTESAGNRFRQIPLEAPRGDILDRNGRLIADNVPGYSIKLIASNEDSLRAVLARLAALVPDDTIDVDAVVRRWAGASYQPALVFASGQFNVLATLEEHRALLPGLVIQREPLRDYPGGAAIGHLVGYVGEISESELEQNLFPGARSGEEVGQRGLEYEYDSLLRGRQGVRYAEVTASGRTVQDYQSPAVLPPVAGGDLHTTIDLPLQLFVDSMWRADLPTKRGALVAMTPDGAILAYYSYPTFDPNDFVGGIDAATWAALNDNPDRPLVNRAIAGKFPPASPFKLAIAAMALRRGLVTMDSKMPVPCTGEYRFGDRVWKCWNSQGHGALTLRQAIATSCDIYFYQLGQLLGAKAIFQDGIDLGFGDRTGIDLAGESRPTFPSSVKAYINSRGVSTWGNGEVLNLAIGQGHDAQTLINMVAFYAGLAGSGVKPVPFVVPPPAPLPGRDLGLTPDQLAGLREAMVNVVTHGTASLSLAHEAGVGQFDVAGKTGSGQVTGQQDIAWFISFAPANAARIVVGIEVEEGIEGAFVAKYAVRTIARYLDGRAEKLDDATVTENLGRASPAALRGDSVRPPADTTPAPRREQP